MLTEISGLAVFLTFCAIMSAVILGGAFVVAQAIIGPGTAPNPLREKSDPDTFTCSHCGSGPWHNSWSPEFDPPICPNCSGAD